MITAPVGFQCPECVGEAAAKAPVYDRAATLSTLSAVATPWVSYVLVGICSVVFLFQMTVGVNQAVADYGMRPYIIASGGEYFRLVTSFFLHGSVLHILFNMLVLIMVGTALERILGHVQFLVLYLLSGLGGATLSYLLSPLLVVSVGASGAVFGVMAALVVAGRRLRYDVTQVAILLVVNIAITFVGGGIIDWRAHLGGLVVGAVVAAILAYAPKRNRVLIQVVGCCVVLAVLLGTIGLRTAMIRQATYPQLPTPAVGAPATSGTLDLNRINGRS